MIYTSWLLPSSVRWYTSLTMDHLDQRSQELFSQHRAIADKLKKRFMKKPNPGEASEDYSKLANALKNEDDPQYAALCFTAMAKCDQLTGDTPGEAEAWASAGRQFFQAEEVLYSARHASYEESLEAGVQCFLLSIEVHERQNNAILAAMFCLEVAHRLKHFRKFHESVRFLERAADLQAMKPECQLQTLEEVASCKIRLREYDGALSVLTKITNETQGKKGCYALLRHHCEVTQLLLLLVLKIPGRFMRAEHIQLLKKYSRDVTEAQMMSTEMNAGLYVLLQSLVIALDRKTGISKIKEDLWKMLKAEQQHLLCILIEVHTSHMHTVV